MALRSIHWHEGMFLRPQHFQAADRYALHLAHRDEKWDLHYNWGLRAIDLDLDALANNRLVIRSLKARMRDGTLVAIPEDGLLPSLDLQSAFSREDRVTVLLAVPVLNLGKSNVAGDHGQAIQTLEAQLTVHGLDRDQALMAHIQALRGLAGQARSTADQARQVLVDHHAAGDEYHTSGVDAGASAFRNT